MVELALHGGDPVSCYKIPLVNVVISEKAKRDVCCVLDSGYLRQGLYTERFEKAFAKRVGANYAYAVSNGTAALYCVYRSVLEPGDEVVVPAFTFFATASTVIACDARPVFADIDPETFLVDVEDVKEKITGKTRAVAPVHLFGSCCDMNELLDLAEDYDLYLVNDCAQAHGTEYEGRDVGSFQTLNCYSFYPSKTMTSGEGGMVTTDDKELYRQGCLLRSHGEDSRYHHIAVGLNHRMTDIAAVIGLDQLEKLDWFLERRRMLAGRMIDLLEEVDTVKPQRIKPLVYPSYSYFTVKLDLEQLTCTRDGFVEALRHENIDCSVHYPIPVTRQPVINEMYNPEVCIEAERLAESIISLPMHPYLTDVETSKIVEAIVKVSNHYRL